MIAIPLSAPLRYQSVMEPPETHKPETGEERIRTLRHAAIDDCHD